MTVAADTDTITTLPIRRPKTDARPRRQPRYNVVLIDDDDHTYQYVIAMLKAVFGYPLERGYQLACEVDSTGRCILLTTTLEHAELKREQVIRIEATRRYRQAREANLPRQLQEC